MHSLVIADTSCLIVLDKIERLDLLKSIFAEITITEEIKAEFNESLPNWIAVRTIEDKTKQKILELDLDKGEASAIAWCLENPDALLLIDEKKGRKVASDLNLKILGTLGVFIRAKENQLISSIAPEIEKLRSVEFRMSDQLINQILDKYEK